MKVRDIMSTKLVTVNKELTIRQLIKVLQQNQVSGVPVVDSEGRLEGIVSEKDVIKAVAELIKVNLSIEEINRKVGKLNWVEGIMSKNVITVTEDTDAREVFKIMALKQIHRVPVVKNGILAGIVSASDAHRLIEKL
ncbi:MAG: CBS domain-containing protein [Actinobacteria bacterium]|nr:CBS domain-containing protein [Actinomycetota bacterium]